MPTQQQTLMASDRGIGYAFGTANASGTFSGGDSGYNGETVDGAGQGYGLHAEDGRGGIAGEGFAHGSATGRGHFNGEGSVENHSTVEESEHGYGIDIDIPEDYAWPEYPETDGDN